MKIEIEKKNTLSTKLKGKIKNNKRVEKKNHKSKE
jgi:hypothetical protein